MTKEAKIILFFTLLVFAGLGALIAFTGGPAGPVDQTLLVRDNSRMTGNKDAKVTLVEFGDYQCPACAAAHPIVERIVADYQSNPDFNFVYRHYPLPQHNHAKLAGQAAVAAGIQGKYWEMHKLLFENQNSWSLSSNARPIFEQYAVQLGLDLDTFKNDIDSSAAKDLVNNDKNDGSAAGVNSTPTFYVNGELAAGVPDYNGLKAKIDELLK